MKAIIQSLVLFICAIVLGANLIFIWHLSTVMRSAQMDCIATKKRLNRVETTCLPTLKTEAKIIPTSDGSILLEWIRQGEDQEDLDEVCIEDLDEKICFTSQHETKKWKIDSND